ncbi:hydrogenase maturation protease [Rhodococcus sp. IEGM 1305]|uniref:hydrogenase maturation protease n=1 Tax=Rhodococcus sp. IEGM 1305 TaxID=3047092 RepID=UPI0032D573CC
MTVVVIGLGNDLRRDDGIGPIVARQVADHVAPDVCVSVSDGDPGTLLEAWTGAQLAVIVDAVVCDPAPCISSLRTSSATFGRGRSARTESRSTRQSASAPCSIGCPTE